MFEWFGHKRRAARPAAERHSLEESLVGVETATPDQAQAVWLDLASRGSDAAAGLRAYVQRRPGDAEPLRLWLSVDSGEDFVVAIVHLLQHPDPAVVKRVLNALPSPPPAPQRLLPVVLALLQDADAELRELACFRLPMLAHSDEVATALSARLDDSAPVVQFAAVTALGHLGTQAARAVPALRQLADCRDSVSMDFTPAGDTICLGDAAQTAIRRIERSSAR